MDTNNTQPIPVEISSSLEKFRVRIKRYILIKGLLTVSFYSMILFSILAIIDLTAIWESQQFRWTLVAVVTLILLFQIIKHIYFPLKNELPISELARYIEIKNPALNERISSAIELSESLHKNEECSSKILIDELTKAATGDIQKINIKREITILHIIPEIVITLIVITMLSTVFFYWPSQAKTLFLRAILPSINLGNIYSSSINVTPGDVTILEEKSLLIRVKISKNLSNEVYLITKQPNGALVKEEMLLNHRGTKDNEYILEIPQITKNIQYQIVVGKAITKFYKITVLEKPKIDKINLTITPPAYTGIKELSTDKISQLKIPVGSKLKLNIKFTKPVQAYIYQKNRSINIDDLRSKKEWDLDLNLNNINEKTIAWKIIYKTEDTNMLSSAENIITLIQDKTPVIQIIKPNTTTLKLNPTDTITGLVRVTDDYKVAETKIYIYKNQKLLTTNNLQLTKSKNAYISEFSIDLGKYNLKDNDSLMFFFTVKDNYNLSSKPHLTFSKKIKIMIDSKVLPIEEQNIKTQYFKIKKNIQYFKKYLTQINNELELGEKLKNKITTKFINTHYNNYQEVFTNISNTILKFNKTIITSKFAEIAVIIEKQRKESLPTMIKGVELLFLSNEIDYPLYITELYKENNKMYNTFIKAEKSIDDIYSQAKRVVKINKVLSKQKSLSSKALNIHSKTDLMNWKIQQKKVIKELSEIIKSDSDLKSSVLTNVINQLGVIAKQLKMTNQTFLEEGKSAQVKVKVKQAVIDIITICSQVEHINRLSYQIIKLKKSAITLNKDISHKNINIVIDNIDELTTDLSKKITTNNKTNNFPAIKLSQTLQAMLKSELANKPNTLNTFSQKAVYSLKEVSHKFSGGIETMMTLPDLSDGDPNAELNFSLGAASKDWSKIRGQLDSMISNSKTDQLPLQYKKLIKAYLMRLNNDQ